MFVVDTNVLLYAAEKGAPAHARCRELLERWRSSANAWFLTWPILYEFLRVATHPRVFRTPWTSDAGWQFIRALLGAPGLSVLSATDNHASVLGEILQETPHLTGNILHDTHTAVLMREHGVRRVVTRDTDFHRFQRIEVVDPLTATDI
jgi:uncharacterized protein